MKKLIIIFFVISSAIIYGQDTKKYLVEVSHSGDDAVGGRLAFAIKERIRKSESMRITYKKELRMIIILVTLDQYMDNPGISSCYSFVLCLDDPTQYFRYFITSTVGYCGSSRVDDVAEGLVADTDKKIEELLKFANQIDNN